LKSPVTWAAMMKTNSTAGSHVRCVVSCHFHAACVVLDDVDNVAIDIPCFFTSCYLCTHSCYLSIQYNAILTNIWSFQN
jgi:hypothetical protein